MAVAYNNIFRYFYADKTKKAKKPAAHKVDVKKINKILVDSEEAGIAFYKVAQKFAVAEDKTIKLVSPEKQFALFKARIKKCMAIHNAAKPKEPADLQKALAKLTDGQAFAKLMIQFRKELGPSLPCWACAILLSKAWWQHHPRAGWCTPHRPA